MIRDGQQNSPRCCVSRLGTAGHNVGSLSPQESRQPLGEAYEVFTCFHQVTLPALSKTFFSHKKQRVEMTQPDKSKTCPKIQSTTVSHKRNASPEAMATAACPQLCCAVPFMDRQGLGKRKGPPAMSTVCKATQDDSCERW